MPSDGSTASSTSDINQTPLSESSTIFTTSNVNTSNIIGGTSTSQVAAVTVTTTTIETVTINPAFAEKTTLGVSPRSNTVPSEDTPQATRKTASTTIDGPKPTMSPMVKVIPVMLHLPLGPGTSDVSILSDNLQTIPSQRTRTRDALRMPRMRCVLATIPTTLPNRIVGKVRVVIGTVVGQAYHEEPSPWPAAVIESTGNEDAGSGWPEWLKEHSVDRSDSMEEEGEE